jgi:hypothetical protein
MEAYPTLQELGSWLDVYVKGDLYDIPRADGESSLCAREVYCLHEFEDRSVGIRGGEASPWFFSVADLEAFCVAHRAAYLAIIDALDARVDRLPPYPSPNVGVFRQMSAGEATTLKGLYEAACPFYAFETVDLPASPSAGERRCSLLVSRSGPPDVSGRIAPDPEFQFMNREQLELFVRTQAVEGSAFGPRELDALLASSAAALAALAAPSREASRSKSMEHHRRRLTLNDPREGATLGERLWKQRERDCAAFAHEAGRARVALGLSEPFTLTGEEYLDRLERAAKAGYAVGIERLWEFIDDRRARGIPGEQIVNAVFDMARPFVEESDVDDERVSPDGKKRF